jgi:hypothetical protein
VSWRKLYDSCVCETNLAKLGKLVFETEDAIYLRSRELSKESHIGDEVQALSRAAKVLMKIRTRKLGWHDAQIGKVESVKGILPVIQLIERQAAYGPGTKP